MDLERLCDLAEEVERFVSKNPDGRVFSGKSGKKRLYATAFRVRGLIVCVILQVGERNGVSEITVALDPKQPILIDRVVLAVEIGINRIVGLFGGMIDLDSIRSRITPENAERICTDNLKSIVQLAKDSPEAVIKKLMRLKPSSESIRALEGGAPGLGR